MEILSVCTEAHTQEGCLHGDTNRAWDYPQVNSLCGSASWIGSFSFLSTSFFFSLSFTFTPTVQPRTLTRLHCRLLSFTHFLCLSHWHAAWLKFKKKDKIESLYITTVSGHSGDRCWFAPAKVAEMFVSWSHIAVHACCVLLSFLSDRISFHPFFCSYLSLTHFLFLIFIPHSRMCILIVFALH